MKADHAESQDTRKSAFKNKSSLYKRDPHDFYVEPGWCTELLLDALPDWEGPIWDPACGSGNVVVSCWNKGLDAFGTDIVERSPGQLCVMDFLGLWAHGYPFRTIITNPPYGKAEAFIHHALRPGPSAPGRVAVFVRLDFLASLRRHALFTEHEPAYVFVLSRRPNCPPGDATQAQRNHARGQHDYCWIVWDRRRGHYARCEVRWLK